MSIRLGAERAAADYDLYMREGVSVGAVVNLYGQDHRVLSVHRAPCRSALCSHPPAAREQIVLTVQRVDTRPGEHAEPYESACCTTRDRGLYVAKRPGPTQ